MTQSVCSRNRQKHFAVIGLRKEQSFSSGPTNPTAETAWPDRLGSMKYICLIIIDRCEVNVKGIRQFERYRT